MMALLAIYICVFYPVVRAQTRGDFAAGILYVSNWYQIFVGQGYAASEAFVPLRHLWSLAVEEQFYLLWPLVMVVVLRRSRRRLPQVGVKLIAISFVITLVMGVVFVGGFVPLACTTENSNGYWHIFGRCISINDTLYLSSITRAGGLMMGAGFAMLWRPAAILRGPMRYKFRTLDLLAGVGLVLLCVLMYFMYLFDEGYYNPWLFRGGFFLVGIVTLFIVAAASHQYAATGVVLGNPVFLWLGTRSYGLYLYHWPVYEIIRKQAQIPLTVPKFVLAMLITIPLTEASYRLVETPIRKGQLSAMIRRIRSDSRMLVAACSVLLLLGAATLSFAMADPHCVGSVACSLAANTDPTDTTAPSSTQPQVVPGSSTSSTSTSTTTTIPKVPEKYVAIGESVMVGAKVQLQSGGLLVDAKENRGPEGVKNAILNRKKAGDIGKGTTVVVQVGTNAPVSKDQLEAILAAVPLDAKGVVFMTVHAPVAWVPDNNVAIKALPDAHKNVRVIDWDAESSKTKLCPDGIHVTCNKEAPVFYANLVFAELKLPALK
jgi:peptidoglycan/LPS O-acetylase OafA/YrhL